MNKPYESESNDTRYTANAVTTGQTITGQLSSLSDTDYYKFAMGGAGTLSMQFDVPNTLSVPGYSEYFALSWFDANGTLLSQFQTSFDKIYSIGIAAAGSYYLSVSNALQSHEDYKFNNDQYSITSMISSNTSYESESNDTRYTANAVTTRQTITGQLSSPYDTDYYEFAMESAGTLSMQFDVPNTLSSPEYYEYFALSLYDANGMLLSQFQTSFEKIYSIGIAAAGSYYLSVSNPTPEWDTNYNSDQYNLTLNTGLEEGSTLYDTSGDDILDGFSGYNIIDGYDGLDTVKYSLASTEVSFSENEAGQLVIQNIVNSSESDTLVSMERIQFSDKNYALDLDGNAGVAAKAIIATFGVDSISAYMSAALSVVDNGTSLESLCDLVVDLKLIDQLAGSSSNSSFVGHLFKNVVGRSPNLLENALYTNQLDNGTYTKSSLLALAANTTLTEALVTANSVDLIGVPGSADGEILALQYDLGLG
jgi:hypothetical protein